MNSDINVIITGDAAELTAATEEASASLQGLGDVADTSAAQIDTAGASAAGADIEIASVGGAADDAAGGFDMLGGSMIKTLAPLAEAFVGYKSITDVIKDTISFQGQLTQLVTGAGETEANLKMVGDGILKIGDATGSTTSTLTQAMYLIESAGYHGATGLAVLNTAAEGAKVGNADLQTTAGALTTVMHDYGLTASQSGEAMNFLVSTVANGKMHMDDLTSSLGKILPTASQLGIPLAQVGGAMSTLTVAGIPATRAATALQQTLLNFVNPSKSAQAALAGMGLSSTALGITLTKSGPGGGLLGAIQQITQAAGKEFPVGSAQYLAALAASTGGVRGLTSVLGTSGNSMQTFINNTASIATNTQNAGNKVMGWSKIQGDAGTQLDILKEKLDTTAISLGEKLLPSITKLTENFIKALPTIAKIAEEFIKVFEPALEAIARVIKDNLIPTIDKHKKGLEELIKIFGALVITTIIVQFEIFLHTIDFIIAAISDLIKVFSFVTTELSKLGDGFKNLGKAIMQGFGELGSFFKTVFREDIQYLYQAGVHLIDGLIQGIQSKVSDVVNAVKNIGKDITKAAKDVLGVFSPSTVFAEIGQNVGEGLIQGIQSKQTAVKGAMSSLVQAPSASAATVTLGNPTTGSSSNQPITITNCTFTFSTAAAAQQFFSMNRDAILASKGMSLTQGATPA